MRHGHGHVRSAVTVPKNTHRPRCEARPGYTQSQCRFFATFRVAGKWLCRTHAKL